MLELLHERKNVINVDENDEPQSDADQSFAYDEGLNQKDFQTGKTNQYGRHMVNIQDVDVDFEVGSENDDYQRPS